MVTIHKLYYQAHMLFKTVFHIFIISMATVTALGTTLSQLCIVEELLAKLPAIRAGSRAAGMTRQRYVDRLTWMKELLRQSAIINWRDRQNFARVSQTLEVLKLEDSNGSIRKQPYCVVLTGFPGCGKSRYALEIASACLRERYGSAHASDIVTLNETDEFQSEFRTNHKVVIFDDVGAEAIRPSSVNPWRKVIDFVNNIRKTSLNPNVEMKGNVYIEPDLVIITTNLMRELSVHSFMATPGAIYRRIQKYIRLEEGYEKAAVLGFAKCISTSESRVYNNLRFDSSAERHTTRKDLLSEITSDFTRHLNKQKDFVIETNSLLDQVEPKTLFQSFYSDIVLPMLPTKIPLDAHMEAKLPWYHRLGRRFCVQNTQIAVCQHSLSYSTDSSEDLVPQSGLEDEDLTDLEQRQVQFFKSYVDWAWYACLPRYLDDVLVYQDGIYHVSTYQLYSKRFQTVGLCAPTGGIPSTGRILEIAKRLYEVENSSVSDESTDISALDGQEIPTDKPREISPSAFNKKKTRWGNEGMAQPRDLLPLLLQSDDIVPLSFSDLSLPFGQGFRTVVATAPPCLSLVGYEVDLKYCKPDLIYRRFSERYGFVYVVVEIVTKGLSKGVTQLTKSVGTFKNGLGDSLQKAQVVGVVFTPHHFKVRGAESALNEINLKSLCKDWHKRIKDRCGAVGLKDKEPRF